jgi:hypothetical protein
MKLLYRLDMKALMIVVVILMIILMGIISAILDGGQRRKLQDEGMTASVAPHDTAIRLTATALSASPTPS